MAGFTNTNRNTSSNPNPVTRMLRSLSSFGMNYKDDVIKNVRSMDLELQTQNLQVNPTTGQIGSLNDENIQVLFARMSATDPTISKGYFNLSEENYQKKKEQLRNWITSFGSYCVLLPVPLFSVATSVRNFREHVL